MELVDIQDFGKGYEMVYEGCYIYGPYCGNDKRLRIGIKRPGLNTVFMSYPKYLMEIHLNRYLDKDETVDHIDGDPLNNNLNNLQVLKRSDHAILDVRRYKPQEFICPVCGVNFMLTGKKLTNVIQERRRKNSTGPYCSRSCAGTGSCIQLPIDEVLITNKSLNREKQSIE